jgi:uncharacterized protein YggE
MKTLLFAVMLGIASVSASAFAQVNSLPPTPHILVYGHAEARAIPDKFSIRITLAVTDDSADIARRKVQDYAETVLSGLKQAGASSNEILATTLKVQPKQEFDSLARGLVYKGVNVEREISATFYDLQKLQKFLSTVKASKEVQLSGITTGLRDEAKLREQLRAKSIASTQEKAKSIAAAYGANLRGLYSVSDVAPQFEYGVRAGEWPEFDYDANHGLRTYSSILAAAPPPPIAMESLQTGYVTFSENIYAVFLIGEGK